MTGVRSAERSESALSPAWHPFLIDRLQSAVHSLNLATRNTTSTSLEGGDGIHMNSGMASYVGRPCTAVEPQDPRALGLKRPFDVRMCFGMSVNDVICEFFASLIQ